MSIKRGADELFLVLNAVLTCLCVNWHEHVYCRWLALVLRTTLFLYGPPSLLLLISSSRHIKTSDKRPTTCLWELVVDGRNQIDLTNTCVTVSQHDNQRCLFIFGKRYPKCLMVNLIILNEIFYIEKEKF